MKTPDWATELTEQVCKDYKRALPTKLIWRKARSPEWWRNADGTRGFKQYSHGTYWYSKVIGRKVYHNVIMVCTGSDEKSQKLILLHELAHHIACKHKNQGHNKKFWTIAFDLYDKYFDIEYAYNSEKHYKKYAEIAYQRVMAKK